MCELINDGLKLLSWISLEYGCVSYSILTNLPKEKVYKDNAWDAKTDKPLDNI